MNSRPEMTPPNFIDSKPERDLNSYVKDRLEYKINLYARLAGRYRYVYWTMASTSAIGAALVPALVNLQEVVPVLITTLVSLIVAITVALDRVFLPREHWRNFDLVSALLREEEMRFSTRTGPYSPGQLEGEEAFARLVDRVEDAIHREREETIVMRTSQEGISGGQPRHENSKPPKNFE